jgi:predicted MFS family arabinose efflux permease
MISVLAQAGYGLGLFFITPLGDKTNRKKLILLLQALLIITLIANIVVTSLAGIYLISLCIGLLSVVAQVILPMAASLGKKNKGRTVGIIFTGILTGILAARIFSGYIADILGWRYVYIISAALVFITALLIQFSLPDVSSEFKGNYGQLLRSTFYQIKRFAVLRKTALLGALVFGIFCSFWTTLTFHLSGPPFNYGSETIGLFALLAPVFGKRADRGNPGRSQVITVLMIIASIISVKLFPDSLAGILITVLLLDIGVQATQVTNIATIYTLDQSANSRINTVYMTTYFVGGATGTFIGLQCWQTGGWNMVTWQLLLWALFALGIALASLFSKKQ